MITAQQLSRMLADASRDDQEMEVALYVDGRIVQVSTLVVCNERFDFNGARRPSKSLSLILLTDGRMV